MASSFSRRLKIGKKHKNVTYRVSMGNVSVNSTNTQIPNPSVTRSTSGAKDSFTFTVTLAKDKKYKNIRKYKVSFGKSSTKGSVSVSSTTSNAYQAFTAHNSGGNSNTVGLYCHYGSEFYDLSNATWNLGASLSSKSTTATSSLGTTHVYERNNTVKVNATVNSLGSWYNTGMKRMTIKIDGASQEVKGTNTVSKTFTNVRGGTHTPKLEVVDRFGKKTNFDLPSVTIRSVAKPKLDLNVVRCDERGEYKVDGKYARLDMSWDYDVMDTYKRHRKITVDCTLLDGSYLFSNVWTNKLSNGTLDDTLFGVTSGGKISYLVSIEGGFMAERSYVFTATAYDSKYQGTGGSVAVSTTMTMAQFMIDLHPSGRSIGIGTIAPDPTDHPNGILKVGYDLILLNDLSVQKEVMVGKAVDKSQGGTVKVSFKQM